MHPLNYRAVLQLLIAYPTAVICRQSDDELRSSVELNPGDSRHWSFVPSPWQSSTNAQ